jgi:hypothetical protein
MRYIANKQQRVLERSLGLSAMRTSWKIHIRGGWSCVPPHLQVKEISRSPRKEGRKLAPPERRGHATTERRNEFKFRRELKALAEGGIDGIA